LNLAHTGCFTVEAMVGGGGGDEEEVTRHLFKVPIPLQKCVIGNEYFLVDAFRHMKPIVEASNRMHKNNNSELRKICWFLTHFHADHYGGLSGSLLNRSCGTLFCTPVTSRLIQSELGVSILRVRELPPNVPVTVHDVTVTALDANHCPGSALLLFEFANGTRVLHTGDMRYSPRMKLYPELQPRLDFEGSSPSKLSRGAVDILYLDTTYCNPRYSFPPQEDMVVLVAKTVRQFWDNPSTLFLVGTYKIGKERVLIEIARVLQCKIYAPQQKLDLLKLLDLKVDYQNCFTADSSKSRVHICPLGELSYTNIDNISKKYPNYEKIVCFRPTGWAFNSKREMSTSEKGNVAIHGVPYSEHSSFNELLEFVEFLRPKKIIPTVNSNSKAEVSICAMVYHSKIFVATETFISL
jgi:DNA cross-link repair 1A protein